MFFSPLFLIRMHLEELKHLDSQLLTDEKLLWKKHSETFCQWFADKVVAQFNSLLNSNILIYTVINSLILNTYTG
jgi:hypothetical protein